MGYVDLGVSEGANKGFGEEDVDMLMMYSIVIFAFHKAYRRLETFYWDFRLSQDVNEIKSAMETVEGERKSLSYEKQQIAKKEAVLQNEILQEKENHFNEMTFLKKQMTQLMLENKKLKEQVKLLPSIQSALFSSNEETHVSYDTEEDVLVSLKNELNHLKVVLVGGTNSFRQKFADVLPNIYTISPDEKHIGLRQVAYADVLLFDTTYNNHSQFERCKSVLNTQKIIFLNQGSSLKINATTILKELKK